jgi:PST family polysaccharide transporter
MLAGIFVVADPLVRTFWPDKWEPAIVLVMLLTPVGIVHALSNTTGAIYLAKGRSDWMLRTTLLFGVLQVAALWIGSQWGTRGVAAAYALSSVVFAYLYFAIPFRLIGLRVGTLCRTLAPYAGMALVMAATAMGVRLALEHYGVHHSAVLAACVGTGVILYGLGVWLVRPTALQDLGAVMRRRG